MRPLLRRLAAPLACLAALCAAPPAHADQQTAAAGPVQATLSFTPRREGRFTGLRLAVARNGVPLYARPLDLPGCASPFCAPAGVIAGARSVRVVDLNGDGEPEVLADLFTGGAHCCFITRVLRFDGTGYAATDRDWGDPGYRVRDVDGDGVPELVTADARFAYAFAAFAASAMPVRVLAFRQGGFRDVTATAGRALVRRDAQGWMRSWRRLRHGRDGLGVLAAWAADEYRLGRRAVARRVLARELRAGRLRGVAGWPRGRAYVRALERRLRVWGYWYPH